MEYQSARRGRVDVAAGGRLSEIEHAAAEITIQGARYPEHLERMIGL